MNSKSKVIPFKPKPRATSQEPRPALGNYVAIQNRRILGVYREPPDTYTGVLYRVVTPGGIPIMDKPE